MRVVIDFRMKAGGAGRYGWGLLKAMRELPDPPELLVAEGPRPFTPWGRRAVSREAMRADADLIHGLHFEIPRDPPVPAVVTIQDLIPLDFPASMPSRLRRIAFRKIVETSVEAATRIIVPSDVTASSVQLFGAPPSKLTVVPLGVDRCFRAVGEDERRRARDRFADGHQYVAAVANPKPHKNVGSLAKAAALLGSEEVRFICCGSSEPPPAPLRFAGRLEDEDLRLFYGGAELFVMPSLVEGFGLPAAEAAACGTPVVCGEAVGALPFLGPGAVTVDVSRPEEIAAVMERVLVNPELRRQLSGGAARVSDDLTPALSAQSTLDVYSAALTQIRQNT